MVWYLVKHKDNFTFINCKVAFYYNIGDRLLNGSNVVTTLQFRTSVHQLFFDFEKAHDSGEKCCTFSMCYTHETREGKGEPVPLLN